MSKYQIIFSKNDVLGEEGTINTNIINHCESLQEPSLKKIQNITTKLLPRGKAYWKLYTTQLSKGDW